MNAVPQVERFTLREQFNCFGVRAKEFRFGKQMTLGSVAGTGEVLSRGQRLRLRLHPDGELRIGSRTASNRLLVARLKPVDLRADGWHHCWRGPFSATGEKNVISGELFLFVRAYTPLGVVQIARLELFGERSGHVKPGKDNIAPKHSGRDPDQRPGDVKAMELVDEEIEALIEADQDEEGEAYDDHLP